MQWHSQEFLKEGPNFLGARDTLMKTEISSDLVHYFGGCKFSKKKNVGLGRAYARCERTIKACKASNIGFSLLSVAPCLAILVFSPIIVLGVFKCFVFHPYASNSAQFRRGKVPLGMCRSSQDASMHLQHPLRANCDPDLELFSWFIEISFELREAICKNAFL